jgi:hypothetical protein
MSHDKKRHDQQHGKSNQQGGQDRERHNQDQQRHQEQRATEQKKPNQHGQWTKPTTTQHATGKNEHQNPNNPNRPK